VICESASIPRISGRWTTAWAPGDLQDQDGSPAPLCVRSLLARTEQAVTERGLTARVGAELECTMLGLDGDHASAEPWSPYGMRTSLDRSALLVDLAVAAEQAGLSIEQIHTEYGHDQLEMSLAPSAPESLDSAATTPDGTFRERWPGRWPSPACCSSS
jgi:glutamine synthetase